MSPEQIDRLIAAAERAAQAWEVIAMGLIPPPEGPSAPEPCAHPIEARTSFAAMGVPIERMWDDYQCSACGERVTA